MKQTVRLVVNFEKKNYFLGLALMPIMALLATVLLFIFSRVNIVFFARLPLLNLLIIVTIKAFLYFCIALFSFWLIAGLLHTPFFLKYKGPAAILDESGIWVKNYNFVAWKDIEEFGLFSIGSGPKSLGIRVKDRTALSRQSNATGKIAIFWTTIFKTPHISLGNLDTDYETILVFAHRYLKR